VKSHTVAHCVANLFHKAMTLISIREFTQVKSHTVAQCLANRLHGETSWQSTVENIMLKKLVVHRQEIHAELVGNNSEQYS
jgi:hypothetical protein